MEGCDVPFGKIVATSTPTVVPVLIFAFLATKHVARGPTTGAVGEEPRMTRAPKLHRIDTEERLHAQEALAHDVKGLTQKWMAGKRCTARTLQERG
jgi:hypothetical protein